MLQLLAPPRRTHALSLSRVRAAVNAICFHYGLIQLSFHSISRSHYPLKLESYSIEARRGDFVDSMRSGDITPGITRRDDRRIAKQVSRMKATLFAVGCMPLLAAAIRCYNGAALNSAIICLSCKNTR
jgi:hypothetical protein